MQLGRQATQELEPPQLTGSHNPLMQCAVAHAEAHGCLPEAIRLGQEWWGWAAAFERRQFLRGGLEPASREASRPRPRTHEPVIASAATTTALSLSS